MYGIYANMDPINIPPMLPYIPYMDPMGVYIYIYIHIYLLSGVSIFLNGRLLEGVSQTDDTCFDCIA